MIAYRVKPKYSKDRVVVVLFAHEYYDVPLLRGRATLIWFEVYRWDMRGRRIPRLSCIQAGSGSVGDALEAGYSPQEPCPHVVVIGQASFRVDPPTAEQIVDGAA